MSIQIKSLTIGNPVHEAEMEPQGVDATFNVLHTNEILTIYVAAEGKSAIVNSMRFVNTHSAAVTLTIWFNRTANQGCNCRRRLLAPAELSLPAGFTYIDDGEITLEPGDKIQAQASLANKIQYLLSGVERDVT